MTPRVLKQHLDDTPPGTERQPRQAAPTPAFARRVALTARAALLVPALSATLLLSVVVVSEMFGQAPFSYEPPRNIAEAAGMAMESEMLRFMRQGQDPTAVFDVRPDIISSSITRVTALEAAIWSRRVRLVGILQREGAIRDEDTRRHLVCLAVDIRAAELVQRLAPDGVHECEAGHASRLVEARSP